MQGKPDLFAWTGSGSTGHRRILSAIEALVEANITPIRLGAKEGLAIVDGTAILNWSRRFSNAQNSLPGNTFASTHCYECGSYKWDG